MSSTTTPATAAANETENNELFEAITMEMLKADHNVIVEFGTEKDVRRFALCQIDSSSQHYVISDRLEEGVLQFDSRPLSERAGYMKVAMQDRALWLLHMDRNEELAATPIGADYTQEGKTTYGEIFSKGSYREVVKGGNGPQEWAKKVFGGTARNLTGYAKTGGTNNGGGRQSKIKAAEEKAAAAEKAQNELAEQLATMQAEMAKLQAAQTPAEPTKETPKTPAKKKPAKAKAKA